MKPQTKSRKKTPNDGWKKGNKEAGTDGHEERTNDYKDEQNARKMDGKIRENGMGGNKSEHIE